MSKTKLILKIIAGVVAIALIILILLITNGFTGNPISAAIANKHINKYLQENYAHIPDLDYKETKTIYDFKFGTYGKRVSSKQSKDINFFVTYRGKGHVSDNFKSEVQDKITTYLRLERELDRVVEMVIKDHFPYKTDIIIAGFNYDETVDRDKILHDMNLDLSRLPLNAYLTVYMFSEDLNYEILIDRLLEVDRLMKEHSLMFKTYSVAIMKPRTDDGTVLEGLYLNDFPEEKMASNNLIEVIKEHQVQWEKDHNK